VKEFNVSFEFDIGIADAQVVATINITKGDADIYTLRNIVEANVRSFTDLVGYMDGLSFDVDLISAASSETGRTIIFGINIPVLKERRQSQAIGALSGDLMAAVAQSLPAQAALAYFREAIRIPVDTGFFCYRAIEAIMQSMKTSDEEDEKYCWPRFRETLRIDRDAIMYVKSHSDLPRHGRPSAISDADRAKVFVITDEIIRRFLELLKTKRAVLPEAEFPTVMG